MNISDTVPSVALMDSVVNVDSFGLIVTMLPLRATPVGVDVANELPSTEYSHLLMLVLTELPTTAKLLAGVVLPSLSVAII